MEILRDISELNKDEALNIITKCRENPRIFIEDILGKKTLWEKQVEILESVRDYRRTTVRSGHALGKTFASAACVLWFLQCWKNSVVITTAPTFLQVERVLWGEIRNLFKCSKIPLNGEVLSTSIKISDKHYALGISTDEGERLQGFHSDYVLIVVDEAPGVHEEMHNAIEGLMTDSRCKLLLIGNPAGSVGTTFYESFKSPMYNKIHISCLDSPNYINNKTIIPGLVGKEWIEEKKQSWGEDSPLYQSKVLGDFPSEDPDVLIPLKYIIIAEDNNMENSGYEPRILAIDVARSGKNETVFLLRDGDSVFKTIAYQGKNTSETIGRTIEIINEYDPDVVVVDDTGIGGGVVDALKQNYGNIYGFIGGGKPNLSDRFINLRAETYWNLANKFRLGGYKIPKNTKLTEQLCTIKAELNDKGKLRIQSKNKVEDNFGSVLKSPDYADAMMMSEWGLTFTSNKEIKRNRKSYLYNGHIFRNNPNQNSYSKTGYG